MKKSLILFGTAPKISAMILIAVLVSTLASVGIGAEPTTEEISMGNNSLLLSESDYTKYKNSIANYKNASENIVIGASDLIGGNAEKLSVPYLGENDCIKLDREETSAVFIFDVPKTAKYNGSIINVGVSR